MEARPTRRTRPDPLPTVPLAWNPDARPEIAADKSIKTQPRGHWYKSDEPQPRMQNQHMGTSGMDQDGLLAQDNTYGASSWIGMNALGQNPMAGYDNFHYMPPVTHSLPSDSISRMPPPPTLQPLQTQTHQTRQPSHPHQHSQISLPMVRTNIPLPSQLLPGSSGSYSAPAGMPPPMPKPQPQPPAQTPSPPQVKPKSKVAARKALSNAERKEICELHENNPGIKQTEIGKLFGVERR